MEKHKFTRADGTCGAVSSFMQLPPLRPGYWWIDEAPLGSESFDWREVVLQPAPDESKIFGYDARGFLARQYK